MRSLIRKHRATVQPNIRAPAVKWHKGIFIKMFLLRSVNCRFWISTNSLLHKYHTIILPNASVKSTIQFNSILFLFFKVQTQDNIMIYWYGTYQKTTSHSVVFQQGCAPAEFRSPDLYFPWMTEEPWHLWTVWCNLRSNSPKLPERVEAGCQTALDHPG